MAANKHSKISSSPDFQAYREDYVTVDGAGPFTDPDDGVNARDYESVLANIGIEAGVGNVTLNLLWWSPILGKFVPDPTAVTWTIAAGNSVAVKFDTYGRRFMLAISANAAGLKVNIEVAGFNIHDRYD